MLRDALKVWGVLWLTMLDLARSSRLWAGCNPTKMQTTKDSTKL